MRIRVWFLAILAAALAFPAAAALRRDDEAPGPPPHKQKKDEVGLFSDVLIEYGRSLPGDALAICGDVDVDGTVGGNASAFFGDTTINGPVKGAAVAIMGDLVLGPQARVEGDAICIGGVLRRDPGAVVHGRVIVRGMTSRLHFPRRGARAWQGGFSGTWILALVLASIGGFFTLVFPRGVRACGATFVRRPLASFVAALVTSAVFPFLFVVLVVSLVGLPLAVTVLPALYALLWLFGLASLFACVGQLLSGRRLPLFPAAFLGGLLFSLLCALPFFGLLLFVLFSWLMTGAVMLSIYEATLRQPATRLT